MRKFFSLILVVAMLAGVSCTTDVTEDLAIGIGGKTELTVSLEGSRIALGDKVGGEYQALWSEGDKISINGIASGEAAIDDANKALATFSFEGALATPYNIVYPAAAAGKVTFAAEQSFVNGTFSAGATPMYGYTESASGVTLQHLAGVLKIGVTGSATLLGAQVSTIDRAPIAGLFDIDCATGEVTATESATEVVSYSFGDGLALSGEAQYIHIAVPAGVYNELYVTLYDKEGGVMYATVKATDEKPLNAGAVREFKTPIPYEATDEVFVIKDVASLQAFAAQAATLEKNAILVADIDVSEVEWTPIEGYAKTLLGNGYAIKGLKAPLFGTTSASFKGLHLRDVALTSADTPIMGALACNVVATDTAAPVVESCSVSGTITIKNENFVPTSTSADNTTFDYGGLVGSALGVTFQNCVNNATINAEQFAASSDEVARRGVVGGIVGYTSHFERTDASIVYSKIIGCVNNATLNYTPVTKNIGSRIGGIVGNMFGTSKGEGCIEGCVNNGTINQNSELTTTSYLGGIASVNYDNFDNCTNYGNINVEGSTTDLYVGSLMAYIKPEDEDSASVTNNCNYGDINIVISANQMWIGGLVGASFTGFAALENCHNYGKTIYIENNKETAKEINIGGISGEATESCDKNTYYNDCSNSAALTINFTNLTISSALRIGGIGGYCHYGNNGCINQKSATVTVKGNINLTAAEGDFTDSTTQYTIGGFGGYYSTTRSDDCYNYADLIIDATWTATKASFLQIGGMAGRQHNKFYTSAMEGNTYLKGDSSGLGSAILFLGGACGLTYWDCIGLVNNGDISVTGTHGLLCIGGVSGGSQYDAKEFINRGNIIVDATLTKNTYIGGCVGQATNSNDSSIIDCDNYGAITVKGTTSAAVCIGGVASNIDGASDTGLHNHESGKITFDATSTAKIYIGGCTYKSKDALVDSTNEAAIEVNGKISNTVYIGGVVCTQNGYLRENLHNYGNITINGSTGSCFVGGICYDGQYAPKYLNCHNHGDLIWGETATSTGNLRWGGILGKYETADNQCIFDACSNEGNIYFYGKCGSYIRAGGLTGHLDKASAVINNGFKNSGNILFAGKAKDGDNTNLGGVFGVILEAASITITTTTEETDDAGNTTSTSSTNIWTGDIINEGNITATGTTNGAEIRIGGLFGFFSKKELSASANYINTGTLTANGTYNDGGLARVGGIAATVEAPSSIVNAQVYCDILNVEQPYTSMIAAVDYNSEISITNCKLGGRIAKSMTGSEEDDGPTYDYIDEGNFFHYIYADNSWTEASASNCGGCSYLASKSDITYSSVIQ